MLWSRRSKPPQNMVVQRAATHHGLHDGKATGESIQKAVLARHAS